ncbi:MAG: hypothetical protein LBS48_04255 [Treponema sp.]|nr:hypothetical protein [Treponema sp.]
MKKLVTLLVVVLLVLDSCDLFTYGKLGGADYTKTYCPDSPDKENKAVFESIMSSLSGVWYSRHAGVGRLDGYRIGKWRLDYEALIKNAGAVNIFNDDNVLMAAPPLWLDRWPESSSGQRPFFGIYYQVLNRDTVQIANAVNLAALYNGEAYYTETKTLEEAIDKNTVENEAEFISWGVVIPQDREPWR